jgi:hypothetical protein
MPFRGWALLNGEELANSSRLISHMVPATPVRDDEVTPMMACACEIKIPYDDSWTGLQDAVGDAPYVIENAPWYTPARPESAEFAGVWIMDIGGMDSVPVQREIQESICVGGVASRHRDTSRGITFSALVVACTNAGARYGLDWLNCVLRQSRRPGGVDLQYYRAHPEDTAADPLTLRRNMYGVVLTAAPTVVETAGHGQGDRHRQASIFRVEWEMAAANPYAYGSAVATVVNWDTTEEESITWAHAPDCEDSSSCDLPTIYNADCLPPEVIIAPATIPSCGGCLPVCSIERRTWEMPTQIGACDDTVITLRITNNAEDPLTVIMYWQPCGSTDRCDRVGSIQISGLATDQTVVADSVTGRPYIEFNNESHRQVGIVSTPSGRPWSPTLLESMMCWELVAEAAPGSDYTVTVETRDRDA